MYTIYTMSNSFTHTNDIMDSTNNSTADYPRRATGLPIHKNYEFDFANHTKRMDDFKEEMCRIMRDNNERYNDLRNESKELANINIELSNYMKNASTPEFIEQYNEMIKSNKRFIDINLKMMMDIQHSSMMMMKSMEQQPRDSSNETEALLEALFKEQCDCN